MNVTLECGQDDLTMWFGNPKPSAQATPVDGMPQCEILTEHGRRLCGFRFRSDLAKLCPYELAKLSAINSEGQIVATIQSTYDLSCDMGYLYFDKRGAGSVKHSIDCGSVVIDIGEDGAIIGVEVFSPSDTLPVLTTTDVK